MKLKVKKLCARAKTPEYAHDGDACFDIRVLIDDGRNNPYHVSLSNGDLKIPLAERDRIRDADENTRGVILHPGESMVFKTGLSFEIEPGYVMRIYPRSSTGIKKHIRLDNGTGVIDSGYRGEVHVSLHNFGSVAQTINDGDRLAQAEIAAIIPVVIEEAEDLTGTSRGSGGIGSSGTN
jgi:dUTP pyrophosphatase